MCVCVLDGGVECKTHLSKIFPDTERRGLAEISLRICWGEFELWVYRRNEREGRDSHLLEDSLQGTEAVGYAGLFWGQSTWFRYVRFSLVRY